MKLIFCLIPLFFISTLRVFAQSENEKDVRYTICFYRENRKEGKWVKQTILIDSVSYLKIGNRSRAIFDITTNVGDTLDLKIYYSSLGQKRDQDILLPVNHDNDTVYIKSYFYTENYNPLTNRKPNFWVDGIIMDKELGQKEFGDNEYFKDPNGKKITKIEIKIDQ